MLTDPGVTAGRDRPDGFELVHADDSLLVLHKPAGLLCVPGRGADKQDSLANRVQAVYPDALVVHRLDMATSGLLLMARGKTMQRELGCLFEQRRIYKRYVARVAGRLDPACGQIELPLLADWPNRPRQKVDFFAGKPAVTRYRLLEYAPAEQTSRVELLPLTGRSHQLRVHMQALGHPILGDPLYGDALSQRAASRLCLHAARLGFVHPATRRPVSFCSEPPF